MDLSNINDIKGMFSGCHSLISLPDIYEGYYED